MSFNSKGSSDATEMFNERLEASKGGPLRDRDEDPVHDGGFGATITDLGGYFPEAHFRKVNEGFESAGPKAPLEYEVGTSILDPGPYAEDAPNHEPEGFHYADDKIIEKAEAALTDAVIHAMREPESRKKVVDAITWAKEDPTVIADIEAQQAAVDAYAKSPSGNWIR